MKNMFAGTHTKKTKCTSQYVQYALLERYRLDTSGQCRVRLISSVWSSHSYDNIYTGCV